MPLPSSEPITAPDPLCFILEVDDDDLCLNALLEVASDADDRAAQRALSDVQKVFVRLYAAFRITAFMYPPFDRQGSINKSYLQASKTISSTIAPWLRSVIRDDTNFQDVENAAVGVLACVLIADPKLKGPYADDLRSIFATSTRVDSASKIFGPKGYFNPSISDDVRIVMSIQSWKASGNWYLPAPYCCIECRRSNKSHRYRTCTVSNCRSCCGACSKERSKCSLKARTCFKFTPFVLRFFSRQPLTSKMMKRQMRTLTTTYRR